MFVPIYSSINRERAKQMSEEHRSWERFIGWISHSVLHAYFIKENFENRSRINKILLLKFLSRNNFHFFHIKLILSIFSKFFEEKYKYLEKRINSLETSFYENRIREIKTSNARSTSISTSIALIRAGYRNGEKETERGGGGRSEPRVGNTGRIDASGPRSQGLAWRRRCSKLGTCLAREEGGGWERAWAYGEKPTADSRSVFSPPTRGGDKSVLQARVRDRLSPVRGNVLARIRACRLSDGFESRSIRANPFPPSTLFQLSLDRKITWEKIISRK